MKQLKTKLEAGQIRIINDTDYKPIEAAVNWTATLIAGLSVAYFSVKVTDIEIKVQKISNGEISSFGVASDKCFINTIKSDTVSPSEILYDSSTKFAKITM